MSNLVKSLYCRIENAALNEIQQDYTKCDAGDPIVSLCELVPVMTLDPAD
jgi:hypothetical protein